MAIAGLFFCKAKGGITTLAHWSFDCTYNIPNGAGTPISTNYTNDSDFRPFS